MNCTTNIYISSDTVEAMAKAQETFGDRSSFSDVIIKLFADKFCQEHYDEIIMTKTPERKIIKCVYFRDGDNLKRIKRMAGKCALGKFIDQAWIYYGGL